MNTEKVLTLFTDYFVDSFRSIAPELSNSSLTTINEILVEEMMARYDKLISKKIQYPEQFTEQNTLALDELRSFIKKENRRKVESGSLEDRLNRFLDENLPK